MIASEYVRAQRIEWQQGLTAEAALESVRHADHDLGARVRFLYHLDWEAPLLYDIVLNTERLSVPRAVAVLREMLADERFASTDDSRQELRDRSLTASARAALLANPTTRPSRIRVTAAGGAVELTGLVISEAERRAAEAAWRGSLASPPYTTGSSSKPAPSTTSPTDSSATARSGAGAATAEAGTSASATAASDRRSAGRSGLAL